MKLPSVDALVSAALSSLRRFPAVMFAAVLAAFASVMWVDAGDEGFWFKLVGTATLAIPFFLAVDLLVERRALGIGLRIGGWLVGAALLAGYMVAWYNWSDPLASARWLQSAVAFHMMVAIAPFVVPNELQGFWRFNWTLLLRACLAALYAHVLYAGIAIALLALDNLFGLEVNGQVYAQLYFAVIFVFATWHFLSGVPQGFSELNDRSDYPAGLKVFAQYMLLPIVVAYQIILTLYFVKVIITQVWPSGWIGWLVSCVATVGIFALLLVFPIAERAENRWMRNYARAFYIALLPSIVMLWLAIWKRIDQYGVTEARYFLAVLSIWLGGIAVFYAVTRSRNIKLIPMTLCLAALITFEGPWGAFGMSHRSQVHRLETILERNQILQDGAIQPATGPVEFEDRREISAILHYLVSTHGTPRIDRWFGGTLAVADTIGDGLQPSPRAEADARAGLIAGLLGVDYVGQWESERPGNFSYFVRWDQQLIPIDGYDRAWQADDVHEDSALVGDDLIVRYDSSAFAVRVFTGERTIAEIPLQVILDSADAPRSGPGSRSGVAPDMMRYEIENAEIKLAAYLSRIGGERSGAGIRLWDLSLKFYYTLKN